MSLRLLAGVAVCVAVVAVIVRLPAPTAIWAPRLADHPGYSPLDPVVVQEAAPAAGLVDGVGGWLTRTGQSLMTAIGAGDLTGPVALAAVGTVGIALLAGVRLTGSMLAAIAGALGLAFGGVFWSRAAGGHPAVYAALFTSLTLGCLVRWSVTRRRADVALASIALALTAAVQPLAVLALPAVLGFVGMERGVSVSMRIRAAAMLVVAAAAGSVAGWWAIDGGRLASWVLPAGDLVVVARLRSLGAALVSDFGILGLGLLASGAWSLALGRRPMLILLGGWTLAVTAGAMFWAAPDWHSTALSAVVPAWLIVTAGMQWMTDGPPPARRRVAAVLVVLLPIMSFAGHLWAGTRARSTRTFVARYLDGLDRVLPGTPVVLAEGGVVDRAVLRRMASADDPWERIAQDPSRVEAAHAAGRPVVAFAGARANLNELGFRFEPVHGVGVAEPVLDLIDTVPDGWVVAVATGPGFADAVAATDAATFAAIGGRVDVSRAGHEPYAMVGRRGTDALVPEAAGPRATAEVRAGDSLEPSFRWPATLRAVSDADGGFVEYGDRRVAETRTGVAIAVVTGTGDLAAAYAAEAPDLRIIVTPPDLQPSIVSGREPCVPLAANRWTDITAVTSLASLGARLRAGERLTLYAGASHALYPRQQPLRHPYVPQVTVDALTPGAALAASLARDGFDDEGPFTGVSAVYRIEATSPEMATQLALRLGGMATVGVARLATDDPERVAGACAAMRGGPGLFAGAVVPDAATLDLADDDLFSYGWGRLEGGPGRELRWTGAYDAELLVPMAETVATAVTIEAMPINPVPTDVEVLLNGVSLGRAPLRSGADPPRWTIPAGVIRAGLNRMVIRSSALTRPSDVGPSLDDRLLGVGVRAIRFRR